MSEHCYVWGKDEYKELLNVIHKVASTCTKSMSTITPTIIQINKMMDRIRPFLDGVKTQLSILEEFHLVTIARDLSKLQLDYTSVLDTLRELESSDRS